MDELIKYTFKGKLVVPHISSLRPLTESSDYLEHLVMFDI